MLESISESRHLQPGEGRRLRMITDLITIKATSEESGGAYALFETETPPAGGSPPHMHRYEDASFYVLEGSYTFLIDGQQIELGSGGYVFAARGTEHAYANPGSTSARMLVLVTPGGVQEQFLDDVGDPASRPQWEPDMDRVLAVAPKYGIEFSRPVAAGQPERNDP